MFGYVTPVKSELRQQDFVLYRAFYCGICSAIGHGYGTLPRFSTNYDIAFLGALLSDVTDDPVTFSEGRCLGNPFRKKLMVGADEFIERICAANVILTYYKLEDDVLDGGGVKKKLARRVFSKAYGKARELLPAADALVSTRYNELRELEKAGEKSLDKVADRFASMLSGIAEILAGEKKSDNLLSLCYNIGKFVYLADALDDIGEDFAKKNYNPFLASMGEYHGRKEFFSEHAADISFALNSTVNRAIAAFNSMNFTQSSTLLKNVVHVGLRAKLGEILSSDKKIPAPKI